MNPNKWVMSMDNPTRARHTAYRLWDEGIRSSDREIIILCYGYTENEADTLIKWLKVLEARAENYNPEIGF